MNFNFQTSSFVFEGYANNGSPPKPGKIRFLLDVPNYDSRNWFHILFIKDRTLAEWKDCIEDLRAPIRFSTPPIDIGIRIETPPFDPDKFVNRWTHAKEAAEYAEAFLHKNMRARWLVRKWISRVRERIYRKRVIGADMDIATQEPIPDNYRVAIVDPKSKCTYIFHALTLAKSVLQSLWYQTYGFADPRPPKNPYTNLVWNLGQLCKIFEQIVTIYMRERHVFPHKHLMSLRNSGYDISTFYGSNHRELQMQAIHTFFKDTSNPDFLDVFEEALVDALEEMGMPKDGRVFQYVSTRSVDRQLLNRWDDLLSTFWVYQNYQEVFHTRYKTLGELFIAFHALYGQTLEWIIQKNRYTATRRREVGTPPLPPSPVLNVTLYDDPDAAAANAVNAENMQSV